MDISSIIIGVICISAVFALLDIQKRITKIEERVDTIYEWQGGDEREKNESEIF